MDPKQQTYIECLPKKFCIQALMAIIQEALNQLYIIRKINNWPEPVQDIQQFVYKTIEERYSVTESQLKDKNENSNELRNNSRKIFHKNCTLVESVLTILQEELATCGTFEQFSETVEGFIKMKKDDEKLLVKTLETEIEFKKMQETFEKEKMDFCTTIEKCMSDTGKLKDKIEVKHLLIIFSP